ncbi:hypothetical protein [Brevibacterium sediminis]
MVRSNRPGRMLPALTTSIAAAAAVGTSVALMFLVLFAFLFALGLVVVDDGQLGSELMHPVSFFNYPRLA